MLHDISIEDQEAMLEELLDQMTPKEQEEFLRIRREAWARRHMGTGREGL